VATSYGIKVYIADSTGEYCDFTDKIRSQGEDRLVEIGNIQFANESKNVGGVYTSSIGSVTMDNHDGFWDDPDQWNNIKTEFNAASSWNKSKNGREINLQKARLKVVVETTLLDGTIQEDCVGVFYIRDFSTDSETGVCKLDIVSLNNYLKKMDADKCRDGRKWYESKSVIFLIKELLKLEFADTSDNLPASFKFPDVLIIPTYDGERTFSNFGRPPEYIASTDDWENLGLTTRSIVWSNDSVVGKCLYLGCDNYLYKYTVQDDSYALIGSVDSAEKIKRLWINPRVDDWVFGAAWEEPSDSSYLTTVRILYYDGENFASEQTIANVFTGEYIIREGNQSDYDHRPPGGFTRESIGWYDDDYPAGENILLPFDQMPAQIRAGTCNMYSTTAITSTVTTLAGTTLEDQYSAGYYIASRDVTDRIGMRYTFGQGGVIELVSGGTAGAILYCLGTESVGETTYSYKLYKIATSTSISIVDAVGGNDMDELQNGDNINLHPLCMCMEDDLTTAYIAVQADYLDGTDSITYIYKVWDIAAQVTKYAGGVGYCYFTTIYDSSSESAAVDKFKTFLHMKYNDTDIVCAYINRNAFGKGNFGGVGTHPTSDQDSLDNIKETNAIPIGMGGDSTHGTVYAYSNGIVCSIDDVGDHVLLDDGNPYVEGEPNISSNICIVPYDEINLIDTDRNDRTKDIVFGCSAPYFPNETQKYAIIGKYYFWKFDKFLADRIDCADFNGMNVWDAISKLSQVALGYLIGFDTDDMGSFFLTSKGNTSYTTSLTITQDPDDNSLVSISKDRGLDEIYNYCKIIPYYSKMSDINRELYLSPRALENDEKIAVKDGDISIDVRADYSINLKLICERGGTVNNVYTNLSANPLFRWQAYERSIEARTVDDVAATFTQITVASTFRGGEDVLDLDNRPIILEEAINVYDYALFINPTNQAEELRRITGITGNVLTLEDAVTFAVPSGTIFEVTHGFDINGTQVKWSSDGVTRTSVNATSSTTIYVESIRDLSTYTVISIKDSDTFSRIVTIGAWSAGNSGYEITLSSIVTCLANKKVYAFYSPSLSTEGSTYDYFQIGGTGIYIQIIPENSLNINFKEGDRITINSDGLVLESSEQSAQIAQNITSINTYGRLEFSGIDNRFLSRNHARHYCRNLVDDYNSPHYILIINRKLHPLLRFTDTNGLVRLVIYSPKLFKKYYEILSYPRSITHNLKAGKTTIVCRDVEAY